MAIQRTFGGQDGGRLPCQPGSQRTEYLEPQTRLRLRVTSAGARAWSVVYWSPLAKTPRRLKLGDAARMPLSEARKAARAALTAVEQERRDPFAEGIAKREQERQARKTRHAERLQAADERRRKQVTFGVICTKFIEHRATVPGGKYGRVATPRTVSQWGSTLKLHVAPVIGDRLTESLTSEDIVGLLEASIRRSGKSVPRDVLAFLSAVWSWMADRQRILGVRMPPVSPLVGLPKIGAPKPSRDRVLSPAEIWRLWKATEGDSEAAALRFILLTACRVREGAGLPWSEIDLDANVWTLPAARTKAARTRRVPLSPQALAILTVARANGSGSGPFDADPFGIMTRVRARMKAMAPNAFADFQARDLRRTAATRCALLGAPPHVVALVLDHASPDPDVPLVTSVYLRSRYETEVREALNGLGAWIDLIARNAKPPAAEAFGRG